MENRVLIKENVQPNVVNIRAGHRSHSLTALLTKYLARPLAWKEKYFLFYALVLVFKSYTK